MQICRLYIHSWRCPMYMATMQVDVRTRVSMYIYIYIYTKLASLHMRLNICAFFLRIYIYIYMSIFKNAYMTYINTYIYIYAWALYHVKCLIAWHAYLYCSLCIVYNFAGSRGQLIPRTHTPCSLQIGCWRKAEMWASFYVCRSKLSMPNDMPSYDKNIVSACKRSCNQSLLRKPRSWQRSGRLGRGRPSRQHPCRRLCQRLCWRKELTGTPYDRIRWWAILLHSSRSLMWRKWRTRRCLTQWRLTLQQHVVNLDNF